MCTATNYVAKDHYFGRNLDLEFSYHESVTITPRNFPLPFRTVDDVTTHHALIGMTTVADGYPLYYDATNEKGLSMAGLNFPGNADYKPETPGRNNITPFEFIPWILGQLETVSQAREALQEMVLVDIPFSAEFPLSPLHWIISDREESITVESVKDGLRVYDNPVGLLTNNPTFDIQLFNLNNYASMSTAQPENHFSKTLQLDTYSRGLGAVGLPGDLSSMSRFVKAAFTAVNSVSGESESEAISQFFHILGSVAQQRGCVEVGDKYEITIYSSCCNTDKGIYYYTTYENSQITSVDMHHVDLDGTDLSTYPLVTGQQILAQN
ncbi:linear amide C-N hydrolase [Aeromicrobium sp. SMF47]|uniref:choloylglycine hydrolase n=1 Tax=Aeromicrobium TaxID=2040 RepID=UPI0013BF74D1|nr:MULTISPECIES: choloylglycine hydrolase [Aeromicrobium]MRJ77648.1 linear amide C-N hydrolase [Aeromicrobium yanjiei]MRK02016.1 linear amide C-N hydrolase [Aeromicrobium sp. S22]